MAKQTMGIMEVPHLLKEYPKPQPTATKREDTFNPSFFTSIDENVASTPLEKMTDFQTLVNYLTTNLPTDLQKVRAIFSWIGQQNTVDTIYPDDSNQYTPNAFLKAIKGNTSLYPQLFAVMCREANIPCVILQGRAKAGKYQVGDTDEYFSSWNAVYINREWRLVHCNWAFVSLVGLQHGGWMKIEVDGKNVKEEIKASEGKVEHSVHKNDYWFLVDPEVLIYHCRPQEDSWQLLTAPVSLERFLALPYIQPRFTESHLFFRSGQNGTVESFKGMYKLIIMSKDSNLTLTYELLFKTDNTSEFPNADGADRYVAMARTKEDNGMMFRVTFPMEGTYKLSLYQKIDGSLFGLCDFKLICKERRFRCYPLPANPAIGWGLGPKAKEEGIYDASHHEGIVEARDGRNLEISFSFKGIKKFLASLKHATLPEKEVKQFITTSIINNKVSIKLRPDDGEYALLIDSYRQGHNRYNVLNYLIEAGQPDIRHGNVRENATERMVRRQLIEATEERNRDALRTAIEKFKSLRMEDRGNLTEGKHVLEILLVMEELKNALLSERTDKLERAIRRAETSGVAEELQPEVQRARNARTDLLQRQASSRPVSAVNRKNMGDMRALKSLSESARDVFKAVFMLLGERKIDLQDSHILKLLKQTGDKGLMYRLQHFSPEQLCYKDVKTAQALLEKYPEDKVKKFDPALRKVHQEGLNCVGWYNAIGRSRAASIMNNPSPVMTDKNEDQDFQEESHDGEENQEN